jgi:ribosomal 50S subunit-recycling heat shock protein
MKHLLLACLAGAVITIARAADEPKPAAKPSINIAAGTVVKIDAEKKTFEIKVADEKTQTFSVGEQTRFTKDDKEMQFSDLAVGNYLRFTFRQNADSTATASRVFVSEKAPTVEPPPAEKPPEEK